MNLRDSTRHPFCAVMLPPRYAIFTGSPALSFSSRFGMPSRALDSARGLSVSGRSGLADAIVPQSIVIMEERNILYKFIRIFLEVNI